MIKHSELHPTWPTLAFPKLFSQEFWQVLNNFHNIIFKKHFGFLFYFSNTFLLL